RVLPLARSCSNGMEGTVLKLFAVENALDWSHGVVAFVAAGIGAITTPFFQYLARRYSDGKKADLTALQLAYQDHQKLRNDLMTEILENRKQVSPLQQDNLKYLKENVELHVTIRGMETTIQTLQAENASLRARVAEMQAQINRLSGAPTNPPVPEAP